MNINQQITYPSNLTDTFLPSYVVEGYSRFVTFMRSSQEAQERTGFGQDLLQNLRRYRNFDIYKNEIVQTGTLAATIGAEDDELELIDSYGFVNKNGVIVIGDEVILYREKEGNFLKGLQRGASATTILPTYNSEGTYTTSSATFHDVGDEVGNVSVLFIVAILENIHKSFAPGINSVRVTEDIQHSSLLQNIRDFFQSKGTKLGVSSLFKIIFGKNDVDVEYPGDKMIVPSTSTWIEDFICRSVPISEVFYDPTETSSTPKVLLGSEIQFRSFNDEVVYGKAVVQLTNSYPYNDSIQYNLVLDKDNLEGEFLSNPSTKLTRVLKRTSAGEVYKDLTTITVDSTNGFPDSGVLFIENEAITYTSKSGNQFFGCTRGYIGVENQHSVGTTVYGPYYILGTQTLDDGTVVTSKSWPLGLVSGVSIKDGGLYHSVGDNIEVNGPGLDDPREVSLETWRDNPNDNLATQGEVPPELGDIRQFTYGVTAVYFDDRYIYINGNGLPETTVGPFFYGNPPQSLVDDPALRNITTESGLQIVVNEVIIDDTIGEDLAAQSTFHVIPRRPEIETNLQLTEKGSDEICLFIDSVPGFSQKSSNYLAQGKIDTFTVTNSGSGYVNPTVVIDPALSTATATVVNGEITAVTATSDADYTTDPTVRISSGENGEISLTFDKFGRILTATVSNVGSYYNDIPELLVVDGASRGRSAKLSCTVSGGGLDTVTVDNPGIDYNPTTTFVTVVPVGSGATVTGQIERFHFDRVNQIQDDLSVDFDNGNGYLFPDEDGDLSRYGYAIDPVGLRDILGDIKYDEDRHSPIIGWAFDGNPIYGPFAYTNGIDGKTSRMTSSYKLHPDRSLLGTNPPALATYAMGTFCEDYVYELGYGTLDANNGRVCNTPDFPKESYPNGVYCYFITNDVNENPAYPYIIGENFQNRPAPQRVEIKQTETTAESDVIYDNRQETTYDDKTIIFDFNAVNRYRSSSLTVSTKEGVELEIVDVTPGSVDEVLIQNPGTNNKAIVGDYVFFNTLGTGGGGSDAKVSWLSGECIQESDSCYASSKMISHRQLIDLSYENTPSKFTFIVGQEIETFGSGNIARAIVSEWDTTNYELIVQTITSNLIRPGDRILDARGNEAYIGRGLESAAATFDASATTLSITHPSNSEVDNIVLLSNTEPTARYNSDPLESGDIWWSINTGKLYIYYVDFTVTPSRAQWVTSQPYGSQSFGSYASDTPTGATGANFVATGDLPRASQIIISDTAPTQKPDGSDVRVGDLWWSSVTGTLYIWNSDAPTGSCIVCGCTEDGALIEYSSEWVSTDPASPMSMYEGTAPSGPFGSPTYDMTVVPVDVVISPFSPDGANEGNLWWSTETGKMYVRYEGTWVVANPSGVSSTQYGYAIDGTTDGSSGGALTTGTIVSLPELPTQEQLFFDRLCEMNVGDSVDLMLAGRVTVETSKILGKDGVNRFGSMNLERDQNSVDLPDGVVLRNTNSYKIIVSTKKDHNLNPGDEVRFITDSPDVISPDRIFLVDEVQDAVSATGTAVLSAGTVASVTVLNPGSGYDGDFYVDFIGGGGLGAAAIARVTNGQVTSVEMVNAGSGYTSVPSVNFAILCNSKTFTIFTDDLYSEVNFLSYYTRAPQIESYPAYIQMTSQGTGYTTLPSVPGIYKNEIDRAVVNFIMSDFSVESITVINGGNRYVNPEVFIFDADGTGTGATATANVVNEKIESITVNTPGDNYTSPRIVIYEPGDFTVVSDDIGKIVSFNVISPGREINADSSLKPEIIVDTKLILKYDDPFGTGCTPVGATPTWTVGEEVWQGSATDKQVTATIANWDATNYTLTVHNTNGLFREGENLYDARGNQAIVYKSGQSTQEVIVGATASTYGTFTTDKSKLDSTVSVIQDSKYYQLFSYDIQSTLQRRDYENFVDELVHPAGFVAFSTTKIFQSVNTTCNVEDVRITDATATTLVAEVPAPVSSPAPTSTPASSEPEEESTPPSGGGGY